MRGVAVASLVVMFAAGAAAQQPQVYKAGDPGVTNPVIVTEKKPSYTAAAMRAKISGVVHMTAIVGVDGKPTDIKVVRPLDPGLDRNAVEALGGWRFKPATKDGKPVPMFVTIEMSFTLRDRQVYDKTYIHVKAPVVLTHKAPSYTPEAMRAKIEGVVAVEGIVGIDGKLSELRVVKGLDPGLDANALVAARQWTFTPGILEGRPVPYRVGIELTFTLRD